MQSDNRQIFSLPAASRFKVSGSGEGAIANAALNLQIDSLSDLAGGLLTRHSGFTVIAAFNKCAYLKPVDHDQPFDSRALLCLCLPELGSGPINCMVAALPAKHSKLPLNSDSAARFFAAVSRGQGVVNNRETRRLHLKMSAEPDLTVDYAQAITSRQPAVSIADAAIVRSKQDVAEPQSRLEFVCKGCGLAKSVFRGALQSIIFPASTRVDPLVGSLAESPTDTPADTLTNVVANAVLKPVVQLGLLIPLITQPTGETEESIKTINGLSASVTKLLGLGAGLTPAGDDFLCGVMSALHSHQRSDAVRKLWSLIEPQVDSATHLISACHLQLAASGHITAASMNIMASLQHAMFDTSEVASNLQMNLQALEDCCEQVGSSSGYDFLAGLLFVEFILTDKSLETCLQSGEECAAITV